MTAAALIGIALVLGALAAHALRALARKLGIVAAPNAIVRQHSQPIAHAGGLAVALSAFLTLVLCSLLLPDLDGSPGVGVSVGALGFLLVGFADDLRAFTPAVKFVLQVSLAAGALTLGLSPLTLTGVPALDAMLSLALIVTIVNAVNLTDVCDGLVSGIAVVAFAFFAAAGVADGGLTLALAGACAGFLAFNAPPATIILGDTGSHLLGFMLAADALEASTASRTWPWLAAALLALGVPLFELGLLIVARRRKGIPFWQGSPDHFSIRLQAAGLTKWQTVLCAWAVAAVLGVGAFTFAHLPGYGQVPLLTMIAATVYVGARRIAPDGFGPPEAHGMRRRS